MSASAGRFSPKLYARICGVLYLYIIGMGMFAELYVRAKLVVWSDAEATARNIQANESLFRIGFTGELLHIVFDVAIAMILYALLRPVDRNVALLAAFMRLAADLLLAVASFGHFAALRLLANAPYLEALEPGERHALALLAMKLHGDGYSICLLFFAFACLSAGYLIFRSTFLPKFLGALLAIAGAAYFFHSLAHFLAPALAGKLFAVVFIPAFVAEFGLALWLLVKGVDEGKWRESALRSRAATPS
jgi:hypothetical protein